MYRGRRTGRGPFACRQPCALASAGAVHPRGPTRPDPPGHPSPAVTALAGQQQGATRRMRRVPHGGLALVPWGARPASRTGRALAGVAGQPQAGAHPVLLGTDPD